MTILGRLGSETINLVGLANTVNDVVLDGFAGILEDLSAGMDLRKNIEAKADQEDIIDLAHRFELIKDLDETSKHYLDDVKDLLRLHSRDRSNKSVLRKLRGAVLDLLDVSTSLNRGVIDATSRLFSSVNNSTNLKRIVDKENISLAAMAKDVKIVRKIDSMVGDVVAETEGLTGKVLADSKSMVGGW